MADTQHPRSFNTQSDEPPKLERAHFAAADSSAAFADAAGVSVFLGHPADISLSGVFSRPSQTRLTRRQQQIDAFLADPWRSGENADANVIQRCRTFGVGAAGCVAARSRKLQVRWFTLCPTIPKSPQHGAERKPVRPIRDQGLGW